MLQITTIISIAKIIIMILLIIRIIITITTTKELKVSHDETETLKKSELFFHEMFRKKSQY